MLVNTTMTNKKTDNTMRNQTLKGVVTAVALQNTISVQVISLKKHAKYEKYFKKTKKYLVHAPNHSVKIGDTVSIVSCRPVSKRKHFELLNPTLS